MTRVRWSAWLDRRMNALNENSTDADIVENLGKTDPVYDTTIYYRPDESGLPSQPAKKKYVKKCALCGAEGGHNQENVTHQNWCPWVWAMKRKYARKSV